MASRKSQFAILPLLLHLATPVKYEKEINWKVSRALVKDKMKLV